MTSLVRCAMGFSPLWPTSARITTGSPVSPRSGHVHSAPPELGCLPRVYDADSRELFRQVLFPGIGLIGVFGSSPVRITCGIRKQHI